MALLSDRLRKAASSVAAQIPQPPRLSPAADPRSPDGDPSYQAPTAAGAIMRSALPQTTTRAIPPPPVLNAAQRIMGVAGAGIRQVSMPKPQQEPWGVYETSTGPVAMPEAVGSFNDFRLMGDLITDEQQIERARQSEYSWEKLPDEQRAAIRMPETSAPVAAPGVVDTTTPPVSRAQAVETPAEDEQAFALVRNNQTGTTELVPKATLEAAPKDFFTVITPNVSADEAQRITDLGLVGKPSGTPKVIRGPEDMPGGVVPDLADLTVRRVNAELRDERRQEAAPRAQVAERADGTLAPMGTEPAQGYYVYVGGERSGQHNLPAAPEGYVWTITVEQGSAENRHRATLTPMNVDENGKWVLPEGVSAPSSGPGTWVVGLPEGMTWGDVFPDTDNPLLPNAIEDADLPGAMQGAVRIVQNVFTEREIPFTDVTISDIWGGDIPGTDVSMQDIASDIWNFDIPGLNKSVGDVAKVLFDQVQMPGDDALASITDNYYEQITGNKVNTNTQVGDQLANIPIVGGVLEGAYETALGSEILAGSAEDFLAQPYAQWIRRNPDQFVDIYENGYDVDGDGKADVTGSDAVLTYWLNDEANVAEALWVMTMMDPLTWAGAAGLGGKVIVRNGKVIRMAEGAGTAQRVTGRGIEFVGNTIYIGGRTLEEAGDLGLGILMDFGLRVLRKTGVTGAATEGQRKVAADEADESVRNILNREKRTDTPVSVDVNGRVRSDPDGDPRTTGSEPTGPAPSPDAGDVARSTERAAESTTPRTGGETAAGETEVPAGTQIETEDPNTTITRTEGGYEVATEAGEATRHTTLDQAKREANARIRQMGEELGVPVRWVQRTPEPGSVPRAIDRIAPDDYNELARVMRDDWFESQDIQRGLGSGTPIHTHALESSRIALATMDEMRRLGIDVPNWERNTANYINPLFTSMEQAIREPWTSAVSAQARGFLDGTVSVSSGERTMRVTNPVISDAPLPARGATYGQITASNRYVDMMYQHARWNPESFADPSFREAWQKAVDLDADLRARGDRRSPGGMTPDPLWTYPTPDGSTFTPANGVPSTATADPDVAARAADPREAEGTGRDVRDEYESEVFDGLETGDEIVRYYITDDVVVDVSTIDLQDVPVPWQRRYPQSRREQWYEAKIYDPEQGAQLLFAPDEAQVLDDAVSTLRARGVIEGDGVDVVAEVEGDSANYVNLNTSEKSPTTLVKAALPDAAGTAKRWLPSKAKKKKKTAIYQRAAEDPLPENAGIEIEAIEADGQVVYIARTANGEMAFTETRTGRYHVVDAGIAREGGIERLDFRLPVDNKNGVSLANLGHHLWEMHTRPVDVPTPEMPDAEVTAAPDDLPPAAVAEQAAPDLEPPTVADEGPAPIAADAAAATLPEPTVPRAPGRRLANRRRVMADRRAERRRDRVVRSLAPAERDADLPAGVRRADRSLVADPDRLRFNEGLFQNRVETVDWRVRELAENWNSTNQNAIHVIELDPGEYTVVSGHHRARAAQMRQANGTPTEVKIEVHRIEDYGSRDDAIRAMRKLADEDNVNQMGLSPVEDARGIAERRADGESWESIAASRSIGVRKAKQLHQVSRLPERLQRSLHDNWNLRDETYLNPTNLTAQKADDLMRYKDATGVDDAALVAMHYKYIAKGSMSDADFRRMIDARIAAIDTLKQQDMFSAGFFDSFNAELDVDPLEVAEADLALRRDTLTSEAKRYRDAAAESIGRGKKKTTNRMEEASRKDAETKAAKVEREIEKVDADLADLYKQRIKEWETGKRADMRTVPANGGDQIVMDFSTPTSAVEPVRASQAPGGGPDLAVIPATTRRGERVLFVGNTPDDTPVRIIQSPDGRLSLQYANSTGKDSYQWLTSNLPTIHGLIKTGNPDDYIDMARTLLKNVARDRERLAKGGGLWGEAPVPPIRYQDVVDDLNHEFALDNDEIFSVPDEMETTATVREPKVPSIEARVAKKAQRALNGEVATTPAVDPASLTPVRRKPQRTGKDPTGTVNVEVDAGPSEELVTQIRDILSPVYPDSAVRMIADDAAAVADTGGMPLVEVAEQYVNVLDAAMSPYREALDRLTRVADDRTYTGGVANRARNTRDIDLRRNVSQALGDLPMPPRTSAYIDRLQESLRRYQGMETPTYPLNTRGAGHRYLKRWLGTDPQSAPWNPKNREKIDSGLRMADLTGDGIPAKARAEIDSYLSWWEERARLGGDILPEPEGVSTPTTGRPLWADPDVPEMSEAARDILAKGGTPPSGKTPAPKTERGQGGTVYSMILPVNPKWIEGAVTKIRRRVHVEFGTPSRTHFVQTNNGDMFWLGRPITDNEVEVLTRHTFADGDTFLDRVTRRVNDYGDKDGWKHADEAYEEQALIDTFADYEARLKEIYPEYKWANKAASYLPKPIRTMLEHVAHVARGFIRVFVDTPMQYARDRMLFNHFRAISYPATQALGNTFNATMGGRLDVAFRMWNLPEYRNYKALSRMKNHPRPWEVDVSLSPNQRLHAKLGTREGREIRQTWQGMTGKMDDPLTGTGWMQKNKGLKAFSKLAGSRVHARNGAMFDIAFRDIASERFFTETMRREGLPDYRNQTIGRLQEWGMTREEATRAWRDFTDSLGNEWAFDMDTVIDYFTPRVGTGRATRLGRDWQQAIYRVEADVRTRVQRLTFAGEETRADVVLKRMFLFHHFLTRQTWFYASQMAHHPALINLYFNIKEELEQGMEGWPEYLQGWVKLFGTPFGFQLFLNPFALASTFITFNDRAHTFLNEGETVPGTVMKRVADIIGINPMLMQGANLLGVFGDDFAPDALMMWREANLVTAAINYGRAQGWLGDDITPQGNLYEQMMLDAREFVSGLNPWRDDAVEATSSEENMDREVQMLVVDEAMRDGLDPENPEDMEIIQTAMFDPESPYYQRAVKRWVNGEVMQIVVPFILGPFRPRQRPVNERGEDLYHSFDRDMKSVINTASEEVVQLRTQMDAFYQIGSERDREVLGAWEQIAYGPMHYPITVGGRTYSVRDIHEMTPDQRRQLADAKLQETGYLDDVQELRDERARFLAQPENAQLAQYKQWGKAVRDYPGGIDAYWEAASKDNPNARAYYEDVQSRTYLLDEDREQALTNQAAFFALGGVQTSVWDPVPEATSSRGGVYDPVNIAGTAPQPTPYEEPNAEYNNAIREGLPESLNELQAWDESVKQVQQELGVDPSIPFNELDKDTRVAIEDELKARGINEPDVPWQVQNYLDWAAKQPRGADTSIEAYIKANQAEYREGAPQRFEESLTAAPEIAGPDAQGNVSTAPEGSTEWWQDVLDLLDEHDHRRYPKPGDGSTGGTSTSDTYWLTPYLN